jgi:hypothetical protein
LQCDRPFDEYANIITTGMCGTISAASCSGPTAARRVAGFLAHGLLAELDERGSNGRGSIATGAFHSTLTLFLARGRPDARAPRRAWRRARRVERALIERDLADARAPR